MTCQETSSPRTLVESAPFVPTGTFTTWLVARGDYSSAEIWFVAPSLGAPLGWPLDLEFRVFGRIGEARVLLRSATLGQCLRTINSNVFHGVLVSIRGWNVDAFEVEVESRTTTTAQGRLIAKCWRDDAAPLIVAGAPATHPVEQGAALIAGSGAAGAPAGGVVSVQGPEAGGVLPARPVRGGRFSSVVATGRIAQSVTTALTNPNTAPNLLMIERPAAATKDIEVERVTVSYHHSTASAADGRIVLLRASAVPTGTTLTIARLNSTVPSFGAVARTGGAFTGGSPVVLATWVVRFNVGGQVEFQAETLGDPIILRSGQFLAVQVTIDTVGTGSAFFAAQATFFEV